MTKKSFHRYNKDRHVRDSSVSSQASEASNQADVSAEASTSKPTLTNAEKIELLKLSTSLTMHYYNPTNFTGFSSSVFEKHIANFNKGLQLTLEEDDWTRTASETLEKKERNKAPQGTKSQDALKGIAESIAEAVNRDGIPTDDESAACATGATLSLPDSFNVEEERQRAAEWNTVIKEYVLDFDEKTRTLALARRKTNAAEAVNRFYEGIPPEALALHTEENRQERRDYGLLNVDVELALSEEKIAQIAKDYGIVINQKTGNYEKKPSEVALAATQIQTEKEPDLSVPDKEYAVYTRNQKTPLHLNPEIQKAILSLIATESNKGHLYTMDIFCRTFEYRQGLQSAGTTEKSIQHLRNKGLIKFIKESEDFYVHTERSKFGCMIIQNMIYLAPYKDNRCDSTGKLILTKHHISFEDDTSKQRQQLRIRKEVTDVLPLKQSKRIKRKVPAVPVEESVTDDYLVCLEDGIQLKLLERHLFHSHKLTPSQYRKRWNLSDEYPMITKNEKERLQQQIARARNNIGKEEK